jgi:hypothetical protein
VINDQEKSMKTREKVYKSKIEVKMSIIIFFFHSICNLICWNLQMVKNEKYFVYYHLKMKIVER